jgi:hypothetical protein
MHIAERLVFRTLLIVAMSFLTSCRITHHSPFEDDLEKIDAALNMADEYVHAKEQKIRTIENMLNSRGVNDLQKYHIYGQLFEEYEAYQFDKAKELLEQVGSRTHFTNEMLRHSKWKDARVFMVSG